MSFLQCVEKESETEYVLPRVGTMRVPVRAFLSDALFAQTNEALWRQAAAAYPGLIGLYLMPDTHLGNGIPVGAVAVTEDVIIQAGSGYDISCGVVCLKVFGLHAGDVADPGARRRWITEVELRVSKRAGGSRPKHMPRLTQRKVDDIVRYGARAIRVRADACERQYIPVDEARFDPMRIDGAYVTAPAQVGSVGGGNHFVEMQVDTVDGSVWVMVHCGSRGYGWLTANHYYHAGAEKRGLPRSRREESWLRIDEPLGAEYWAHHNSAANRHIIVRGVQQALESVFGARGAVYYELSHNLVQEETLVLPDGSTQKGFVHRKGATRALPAGHPDLVGTGWERSGHPCLVPGSMLHGAAILFPRNGAYRSACSVNHGSGRVLSRGEAKQELAVLHEDVDREMAEIRRTLGGVEVRGIVGNTARTPLDECGHVYKDLDKVLRVLETAGLAGVAHRPYPVANIKGTA